MQFEQSINDGYAKKITPDNIRAKSLFKAAEEALTAVKKIPIENSTHKSILRELYEGLRQHIEATAYQKGYKFSSHEAITYFLKDILKENTLSIKFDRYRKMRNGINYYGDDISESTVREALKEIPLMIAQLKEQKKEKHE